jgi:hypothetical protein
MKYFPDIGVQVPQILLPKVDIELNKWSIIACDQFTSEQEYWTNVENYVVDAPSTLNLLLPEIYLGSKEEEIRIKRAHETMKSYLANNIFRDYEGFVLVERTISSHGSGETRNQCKTRYGLLVALDLDKYDYTKGSQTLIRASEGTILERIPPRMKIREKANLELPHILVLIDDPQQTVIEPLVEKTDRLQKLYDFELMFGSGHLTGYLVNNQQLEAQVISSLTNLAKPDTFYSRYQVSKENGVLLFAMGDGNHSLATAKAYWEKIKPFVDSDHPARFALVEIENIHDPALEFEPIHRVLFGVNEEFAIAMDRFWSSTCSISQCSGVDDMVMKVSKSNENKSGGHSFGITSHDGYWVASIRHPSSNLPVGTLQSFLDKWEKEGGFSKIDYVHGAEVVSRLGSQPGNLGVFLPAMDKNDFFKTIIVDGVLPRKTFSMGEAKDKRFYLECRRISQ